MFPGLFIIKKRYIYMFSGLFIIYYLLLLFIIKKKIQLHVPGFLLLLFIIISY